MTRDAVPHGPTSPLGGEQPHTDTDGARGYAERQIAAEGRAAGPTEGEIEAAARAEWGATPPWGFLGPSAKQWARERAAEALAAALPLIEARLREPTDRVRAIHRCSTDSPFCAGCAYGYPCPTIRALDDET